MLNFMKPNSNKNPHLTFAGYFNDEDLKPYLFTLSKKMSNGHICVDVSEFDESNEFWEEYDPSFDPQIKINFPSSSEIVSTSDENIQPFKLFNNRLYTGRNFHYETLIINKLKALSQVDVNTKAERKDKLKAHSEFVKQLQSREDRKS